MKTFNPYLMFNGAIIPNAILECTKISQSAKLVWARLSQFAGKDGRCFPKLETLGKEVGLSRSATKKVIRELKDFGLIYVKAPVGKDRLMHKPNQYFFVDHPIFHISQEVSSEWSSSGPAVGGNNGTSLEGPAADRPIEENQLRESIENTSLSETESQTADDEKKKKYHGSPDDHMLALKMYQAIFVVNQTVKEPNYDKWANTIRLMREQDGRTHDAIWHVFDYANRDQFWSNNILSPGALRRHFARLAPRAGIVHPARVVPKEKKITDRCGQCAFAGKGKQLCAGWDSDPDHPACELFQPGKVSA